MDITPPVPAAEQPVSPEVAAAMTSDPVQASEAPAVTGNEPSTVSEVDTVAQAESELPSEPVADPVATVTEQATEIKEPPIDPEAETSPALQEPIEPTSDNEKSASVQQSPKSPKVPGNGVGKVVAVTVVLMFALAALGVFAYLQSK